MSFNVRSNTLILVLALGVCCCKTEEEVICSENKKISCSFSKKIRVHDVIYGHVVGRNECNAHPTTNCTDPNGFCEVAEKAEGRRESDSLHATLTIKNSRCGLKIYIIVNYSCLEAPKLSGENFALNKPAQQSQTLGKLIALQAVDGNKDQRYTSCTHTPLETTPWWRVDLQLRIAVAHVKIVNRNSYGKRLCGFEIRVGDTLKNNGTTNLRCGITQHVPSNQEGIVSCEPTVVGRYVTIVIPGKKKVLTLCEVEVYGTGVLGNQNLTELQLIGSNLPYQGYLVHNGIAFCDPMWSSIDANVACLQLGYPGHNVALWNSSNFGNLGSLFRARTAVEQRYNCSGTEGSLQVCPQATQSDIACAKENAVSVTCQPYIRLSGKTSPLEGRIEVFHGGSWKTVCNDDKESFEMGAQVACRELGFHDVLNQSRWEFSRATGKISLKNVTCRGDEKSLVFCNWNSTSCNHYWDRYVKCSICSNSLLVNTTWFPDSIFNASASRFPRFGPSSARLYSSQPWCLPENHTYENQFLEINLPGIFSLSAIATVGGNLGYVSSYELSYMVSGDSWKHATVTTQKVIFGNTNNETNNVIRRDLDSAIHAKKVRFTPKTWQHVPCMRVELCGKEIPRCNPPNITVKDITPNSVLVTWLPLRVSTKTNTLHDNYSVTLRSTVNQHVQQFTIEQTSLLITKLIPNHNYTYTVKAIGLEECFEEDLEFSVQTKQAGDLLIPEEANITASTFALQLQKPIEGYRYVQIIVIKLQEDSMLEPSYTYTSDKILTVNKSVQFLEPYVTAELTIDDVNKRKTFIIGDGLNYGQSSRKRREIEEFGKGYDESRKRAKRSKKSDDSSKTMQFYNRPLDAVSGYSAFQRTFIDENTYYSSSWSKPVKTNKISTETTEEKSSSGSATGTWIGIGVGFAVILIILATLFLLFKTRQRKAKTSKSNSSAKIINSSEANSGNFNEDFQYDNYVARKYVAMDDLNSDANLYAAVSDPDADDRDTNSETDAAGKKPDTAKMIYGNADFLIEEFESYVRDMKKNDNFGFDKQFKELPQGISYSCTIAQRPENKPKNRYANIVSYDDALVPLSENDSETYINASYIAGVEPKSYIATQGPKENTVSAFWKMVWEQNSSIIVMLTNLKEKGKAKCAKYWTESSKTFEKITLTFEEKQLFPYYVTRKFCIEKGETKRYVTQFHFTAWPDHGVPRYPTQLLAFQRAVRSMGLAIHGPIIVHCSAGVGRSGTFIGIDHCLEKFIRQKKDRSVDVFHIVQEMRKCRVNMIQTLEQYILLHDAILEFILCGINELEGYAVQQSLKELEKVDPKTNKTGFAELFKRLKSVSPVLTKEECKTATLEQNTSKNRTMEIHPADFARVALSSSSSNSDYINATFVDGFQQKNAYIATDSPLDNTLDDFWQMIYEQQSPIVIMLNNWKEGSEEYPEYFPTEKGSTKKYGNIHVRLDEQDEQIADRATVFRKFSISLTSNFENPRIVRHFQYIQWPERGVPENPNDMLQLIQKLQTAQRQNVQGPMVVHCSNGAGRTGTFLTMSICMERLKVEQRFDVFQCIRLIRQRRPQFVENELQLKFCYEVLAKYIESFDEYSNFLGTD